jgi:hypothetical protein
MNLNAVARMTVLLLILLSVSCGKNTEQKKQLPTQPEDNTYSEFINSQSLDCSEKKCPDYVARLVVITLNGIRYCTGTLIDNETMVTSATCLPNYMRSNGLDCSKRIFAIFGGAKKEITNCTRLDFVKTELMYTDPALWRGNFVRFKVKPLKSEKTIPVLDRRGMVENESYDVWKMNYVSDTKGVLVKQQCSPIYNSYANPFALHPSYPHMPLSNCDIQEGNQGAIVMAKDFAIKGILGLTVKKSLIDYLRENELIDDNVKPIGFATSANCIADPRRVECNYRYRQSQLDQQRSNLINNERIHDDNRQALAIQMNGDYRFLAWSFQFSKKNNRHFISRPLEPSCFVNKSAWIKKAPFAKKKRNGKWIFYTSVPVKSKLPYKELKTKLTANLKAYSKLVTDETRDYSVTLNAWEIYRNTISDVRLNRRTSANDNVTYPNIPTDCLE